MIAALAFYAFAAVLIGSAVMVVTSRNPDPGLLQCRWIVPSGRR